MIERAIARFVVWWLARRGLVAVPSCAIDEPLYCPHCGEPFKLLA